jgi:hypothetical protein
MGQLYNLKKNVAQVGDIQTIYEDEISPNVQVASANGAITIEAGVVAITKATACALTLAAPSVAQNGTVMTIVATTAAAHTVTQTTPGFNNAGTSGDVATFGGAIGDSMVIVAYGGRWHTVSLRNVTLG